jgi:hypothetical protein
VSNHSLALVPLEAWNYHSPDIFLKGDPAVDIGLFAEALIYYDQVLVNPGNQLHFARFISWFIEQGKYRELLNLLDNDIVKIYDYAFMTAAIKNKDEYSLWNMQDHIQEKPNTFAQRFLYHRAIDSCIKDKRDRIKLYRVLENKVIEEKSESFGPAIENARLDYNNADRCALMLQSFIDEISPILKLGKPPEIHAIISKHETNQKIHWNINIDQLKKILGEKVAFDIAQPLSAAGHCNKYLWSAAKHSCDLFLGKPMSTLVGDKLYESSLKISKVKNIIEELNAEVEFPDIRMLVNNGKLNINDILEIRRKATKFRSWLQQEGERDRNAIIAYHNEFSEEMRLTKYGRTGLQLFGTIGGAAIGAHIGENPGSAVIGASIGSAITCIIDIVAKLNEDWKPVVFGNWMGDKIKKILEKE